MNTKENAAHVLDLFESEQQRVLALDPRERGMQHHYSRTMSVCHEFRQFILKLPDDSSTQSLKSATPADKGNAPADNAVEALHEAVSAIYFDDSHLYRGALGNIVRFLNPKVYAVLENDSAAAYEITEHILSLRKKDQA